MVASRMFDRKNVYLCLFYFDFLTTKYCKYIIMNIIYTYFFKTMKTALFTCLTNLQQESIPIVPEVHTFTTQIVNRCNVPPQ